jgi:putative thioredoxin
MNLFAGAAGAPKTAGDGDIIKDGSLKTFAQDVIQASQRVPVLVDFWAPWCGPCKQLTPILEKVVRAAKGKVRLVKINIDEAPQIADQLRIKSVPTVYAFVGGQPVTGFAGAQPESQIKLLVEQLLGETVGADLAETLEAAKAAAEAGDDQAAEQLFAAVLEEEPSNGDALGGLARVYIGQRMLEEARQLLDEAPKELQAHAAIAGARAALALAGEMENVGDPAQLQARLERDPDDHEARYGLANALFLRGQPEAAMDMLVQIVKRDREWNDDQARKQLVKFFDALGPKNPATLKGRRMLSTVLFS